MTALSEQLRSMPLQGQPRRADGSRRQAAAPAKARRARGRDAAAHGAIPSAARPPIVLLARHRLQRAGSASASRLGATASARPLAELRGATEPPSAAAADGATGAGAAHPYLARRSRSS